MGIKVSNIKWVFDMNEVFELLDFIGCQEASKILKIPCDKYESMSKSERHVFAYNQFRHNRASYEELFDLPSCIVVPRELKTEDDISDWLSDEYGFCHEGFDMEGEYL